MNFELLRIIIAVLGTGALAWEDWRTSFMDDRILYAMILFGALLNFATLDASLIFAAFTPFTLIMLIGYFLWRAGQFGAGDVYLFAGLQLLLPFQPTMFVESAPVFLPFVLSIFLATSLFAMVGSAIGYAIMLGRKMFKGIKGIAFAGLSLIGLVGLVFLPFSLGLSLIFFALVLSSLLMLLYREEILDVNIEWVSLKRVDEEDIIALNKLPEKKVKFLGLEKVATKQQLLLLKKSGLKKFPVYKHLPRLGPYVFLGLLFCLLFGDALFFFASQ